MIFSLKPDKKKKPELKQTSLLPLCRHRPHSRVDAFYLHAE